MRNKTKSLWLTCFLLTMLILNYQETMAQPPILDPPTDCDPVDPDPGPDDPCIPIDGGLAFLLVAGVGYGISKNRSSAKQQ